MTHRLKFTAEITPYAYPKPGYAHLYSKWMFTCECSSVNKCPLARTEKKNAMAKISTTK